MSIEQDIIPDLHKCWHALGLPGVPPTKISSMLIKGNQKSIFLLFPSGAWRPALVLKYAENTAEQYRLQNEYRNLVNLSERVPDYAPALLTPVRLIELSRGLGLIRRAAPGPPLTFQVSPLPHAGRRSSYIFSYVYGWLLGFQRIAKDHFAEIHDSNLRQEMLDRHVIINRTSGIELPMVSEAARAVRKGFLNGDLPAVVEHGYFNPDNIYLYRRRIYVIDWEWAKTPGLPFVDLFEFALQYTRLGCILGKERSLPVAPDHLQHTFDPDSPLAPILRNWVREACRTLSIPERYIVLMATLFITRYLPSGPLEEILEQARILFASIAGE